MLSNQEIVDYTKKIKNLLSSEDKWTKGKSARNKDGGAANVQSNNAVCWCLTGAIHKIFLR